MRSGKLAVDNLSLTVAPGRVTGFLGPNGAGKSTTMRLLIVLGFPSRRHGRLHVVQKWRTEIAVRSLAGAAAYVLIFTGGRTRGAAVPEAEVMAAYAMQLQIPGDRILVETEAISTWQNLHFLERWWLKAPAAAYELATTLVRRLRRRRPSPVSWQASSRETRSSLPTPLDQCHAEIR